MEKNIWKFLLIGFVSLIFITVSFSGGFILGQFIPVLNKNTDQPLDNLPIINNESQSSSATPAELEELFKPFWESWSIVEEQYVDQPVDQTQMMRGAIQGMLDSLGDQHTSYMDPDLFKQQSTPLEGEYDGIGAWVDVNGEYVTIISPMPGSPAEEAGLQPDDQVIAVDGDDKTGIDGNIVLRDILGEAGTQVTLTILRPSTMETFDVTITRKKIEIPSVTSEMIENNIAYIQLINFGDKTHTDLKNQLKDLLKNEPRGIILDLRNNGGGYLNTAIEVTSEFVSESPLMYEEFGDGTRTTYKTRPNGIATEIPLIVLINEGSASASEIMAGAIQDYGRALLVGKQSYGKGSVQNWIPLRDDQGAVRVTIARWLTPLERQINEVGLAPDVEVEFTEEDFNAGIDPQLDKAIELLLEQTSN
jgi:carboxyl-terminal processing protease